MYETIIKSLGIPVAMLVFVIASRVMHKNPELISRLWSQTTNAQNIKSDRASLEARAAKCRTTYEIAELTDKQLNDLVYQCENQK
jgi:hypothetical protein